MNNEEYLLKEEIKKVKNLFMASVGKVASFSIYDTGTGCAEILSADEESVTVKWVFYCHCYDCQVYDRKMYTTSHNYKYEEIAGDIELLNLSKREIRKERRKSMRYDKHIYKRYKKENKGL